MKRESIPTAVIFCFKELIPGREVLIISSELILLSILDFKVRSHILLNICFLVQLVIRVQFVLYEIWSFNASSNEDLLWGNFFGIAILVKIADRVEGIGDDFFMDYFLDVNFISDLDRSSISWLSCILQKVVICLPHIYWASISLIKASPFSFWGVGLKIEVSEEGWVTLVQRVHV